MRSLHAMPMLENADMIIDLQQQEPQLYDTLTKILNPEEQRIMQGVIAEADARALATQQAQAQVQQQMPQQPNGSNP